MPSSFLCDFPMENHARSCHLQAFPSTHKVPRVDEYQNADYLSQTII